jgi:acetyltransferase-like isoleucine patch superfamily enzyme
MSLLSKLWKAHRHRWYRRGIGREHWLRRHLAYYVAQHGFEIGDYSYGDPSVLEWGEGARLIVGRYCSIATGTTFILGGNHSADHVTTFPMSHLYELAHAPWSRGDIVIGSDVWIGAGATILSGVTIGHGAVIGARALISRDVEPYGVVVGNPAKMIRKRFTDEIIARLLELRWWDLDREQLRPLLPLLQSDRVDAFIQECRKIRPATGRSTSSDSANATLQLAGVNVRTARRP